MMMRTILQRFALLTPLNKHTTNINIPYIPTYNQLNYIFQSKPTFSFSTQKLRSQNEEKEMDKLFSYDKTANVNLNYQQIASKYPFYYIPINVIRNPPGFNLKEEELKTLIALKSLEATPKDLRLAYSILFPENVNYKDLQFTQDQGRIIFSQYMGPNIEKWVEAINNLNEEFNIKLSYLIFWSYLRHKIQQQHIHLLDEVSIINQDPHGILTAYYIQLLIKNRKDSTHLLNHLLEKMEDKGIAIAQRVKICRAIITTHHFQDKFPQKVIVSCLDIIKQSLHQLESYELIYIIRQIYPYRSYESKKLAENLQQFLISKYSKENEIDYHVPLVLKVIRYCNKQGVPCTNLINFIVNNMSKFQVIFNDQNRSKGLFFYLIFQKYNNKDMTSQMLSHLKTYFQSNLSKFSNAEQIEQEHFVRFNKLLLKYYYIFSVEEKKEIKQKYISEIIPFYQHQEEILFYNILIYLRETDEEPTERRNKDQVEIIKHIEFYIEKSCSRNEQGQLQAKFNIPSLIELMYQVLRHKIILKKQSMPYICKNAAAINDSLTSEMISNLFYYLKKNQHQKRSDVKAVMNEIALKVEIFLKKRKINSIKTIYSIVDLCGQMEFQHPFFYKVLQNSITNYLAQNPNFTIIAKDLEFLEEKLIKRGYGSRPLKNLISSTLRQPKGWSKFRNIYVQNQKRFQQERKTKRWNDRENRDGKYVRRQQRQK